MSSEEFVPECSSDATQKRKIIRKTTNRTLMPKKRPSKVTSSSNVETTKRDTKNITRNISRAFQNYLHDKDRLLSESFDRLVEQNGINNNIIYEIVRDEEIV